MNTGNELLRIDRDPALRCGSYVGMFDLPKGLLMLMIIALHSVNDYSLLNRWVFWQPLPVRLLFSPMSLVYYGLIPALFMICGFGERRERLAHNVRRHILPLIKPYVCVIITVMICVPLRQIIAGEDVAEGIREQGLALLLGLSLRLENMGNIGPLWFPITYGVASLLLNLLLRIRQNWLRWLLLAAGAMLAMCTNGLLIPFCVQQSLICAGLMYAGMQLRQHKTLTKRLPVWLFLLVWLLCMAMWSVRGDVEFSLAVVSFGLGGLALTYATGYVLLRALMSLNVLQGKLPDAIRWVGRHMFWICCVHSVVWLAVPWEAFIALFGSNKIPGFAMELLIQVFSAIAGCVLLEKFVRRRRRHTGERKDIL